MVAGAVKADLLADLAAAMDKAIAEGRGIEEFRRDFKSIVAKNGWTGWTGEGSVKGEAWRVGVIYRTNSYTSYAAGRFAQLKAGNFPFWVYRHGDSQEPRVEHLSWNGLVLEPGHPFWVTHYPPSAWGCSCYALGARSERAAKRLGGDPSKKLPAHWQARDPKTGEPVGIDRGWGYAPGSSVADTVNAIAAKIRNWDYGVAGAFMRGLPVASQDALSSAYRALPSTADDVRRLADNVFDGSRPDNAPKLVRSLGMLPSAQEATIQQALGKRLDRPDFRLTGDFMIHARNSHGDVAIERSRGQRPITPEDFARIPLVLDKPDDISAPEKSRSGETSVTYSKRIGGETFRLVVAIGRVHRAMTLKTFFVEVK